MNPVVGLDVSKGESQVLYRGIAVAVFFLVELRGDIQF